MGLGRGACVHARLNQIIIYGLRNKVRDKDYLKA